MEKLQCYIGAPNGIVLCVDSAGSQELNAKFYHAYSRQPIEVCGMEQLLFEMECFFDSIHFPHPTTNDRFFHEIKQSVNQMGKKEKIYISVGPCITKEKECARPHVTPYD